MKMHWVRTNQPVLRGFKPLRMGVRGIPLRGIAYRNISNWRFKLRSKRMTSSSARSKYGDKDTAHPRCPILPPPGSVPNWVGFENSERPVLLGLKFSNGSLEMGACPALTVGVILDPSNAEGLAPRAIRQTLATASLASAQAGKSTSSCIR